MSLINSSQVHVSGVIQDYSSLAAYKTCILKPNVTGDKNIITQSMLSEENTEYIIKWNYILNDETIVVPEGSVLHFDGGSISNGELLLQNTLLTGVPLLGCRLSGTLGNSEAYVSWLINPDTSNIQHLFDLEPKTVFFSNRTYSFKDIVIKNNVKIVGNGAVLVPLKKSYTADKPAFNFLENLFTATGVDEIVITGFSIESDIHDAYASNFLPTDYGVFSDSLLDFEACNSVKISNCRFSNIEGCTRDYTYTQDARGLLINCWDTKNTVFENCEFSNIQYDEQIWIMAHSADRNTVNATFKGNTWHDVNSKNNSSCINFIGNTIIVKDNLVNNSLYRGSWGNLYGLYVYCTNNSFVNCKYNRVFNTSELGNWYSEEVVISSNNIEAENAAAFITTARQTIVNDNYVKAGQLLLVYCSYNPGNVNQHKDIFKTDGGEIPGEYVKVSNNTFIKHITSGLNMTLHWKGAILGYGLKFNIKNLIVENNHIESRTPDDYPDWDTMSQTDKWICAPISASNCESLTVKGNYIKGYAPDESADTTTNVSISVALISNSSIRVDNRRYLDKVTISDNIFETGVEGTVHPFMLQTTFNYCYVKSGVCTDNQHRTVVIEDGVPIVSYTKSNNPYIVCGYWESMRASNTTFTSYMTFLKIDGITTDDTELPVSYLGNILQWNYKSATQIVFPLPTAVYEIDNADISSTTLICGQQLRIDSRIFKVLKTVTLDSPIDPAIVDVTKDIVSDGDLLLKFLSLRRSNLFVAPTRSSSDLGLTSQDIGFMRYVTNNSRSTDEMEIWTGGMWRDINNIPITYKLSGTYSERPTPSSNGYKGFRYFATDLGTNGRPIWWTGSNWVYADGTDVRE